jgi:putative transcriptional regulator
MSAFDKIAAGLEDAIGYAEETADRDGFALHIPASVDVKAIRKRRRLSQAAFAAKYGFTQSRIRDWEQNRSAPDMPSRLLLKVIENEPEALERALAAPSSS